MRPIDADSLIKLVTDSTILGDGFKWAFVALVNGEPTVEPELKTAKWERVAGMNSKCSACGRYFPEFEFKTRPFDINYCPNCGARMEADHEID